MSLFLTILVAFLGAWLALRMRVPAGVLVGSMLAVMLFHITFDMAWMPRV